MLSIAYSYHTDVRFIVKFAQTAKMALVFKRATCAIIILTSPETSVGPFHLVGSRLWQVLLLIRTCKFSTP